MTTEPDRPTDARDVPATHVPDEPAPDDRPTLTTLRGASWTTLRVAPEAWIAVRNEDAIPLGDAR